MKYYIYGWFSEADTEKMDWDTAQRNGGCFWLWASSTDPIELEKRFLRDYATSTSLYYWIMDEEIPIP